MQHYLNKNIRFLRKRKRFGQEVLAKRFNVTIQTVSGWERGVGAPKLEALIGLSEMFKVPIDDIVKVDLSRERISPPESPTIQDKSSTYIKALEVAIRSRCPDLAKDLGLK